jgi:hypothetical protein
MSTTSCSCGCDRPVAGRLARPDLCEPGYRRWLRGGKKPGPPPHAHHKAGRKPWAHLPQVDPEPENAAELDAAWITAESRRRVLDEALRTAALRRASERRDAAGARAVWQRVEDAEAVRVLLACGGVLAPAAEVLAASMRDGRVVIRRAA